MTAFLFDVDDTLYDQKQPFEKAYRTFFPEDQEMDVGRLFVLSRKYSDEVYEDSQTGRMSMEEMYIYRIRKALEELGRTITDEAALGFQACYQSFQYKIEMSREMETLLEDCSRHVPLGLITNGPTEHQWEKIGALGADRWIPKEHVFISGTLQIAKPDRRIFDYAADVMGLDPGETYFIGDSLDNDIGGAAGAGWKTVWINRRKKENSGDVVPDYIVYAEEELHALLRKLYEKI